MTKDDRRAAIAIRNQAMFEARLAGERIIQIARRFNLTPGWTKKIIRTERRRTQE